MPKRPLSGRFCFGSLSSVILGLDPRIHCFQRGVDPRGKPEDDVEYVQSDVIPRGKTTEANQSPGIFDVDSAMRQTHICAATLCLQNAQENVIFQSSKRMYLLPHRFGMRAILLLLPRIAPGTAVFLLPYRCSFFQKACRTSSRGRLFCFRLFVLPSGKIAQSKTIMPIGVTARVPARLASA